MHHGDDRTKRGCRRKLVSTATNSKAQSHLRRGSECMLLCWLQHTPRSKPSWSGHGRISEGLSKTSFSTAPKNCKSTATTRGRKRRIKSPKMRTPNRRWRGNRCEAKAPSVRACQCSDKPYLFLN